MLLSDFVEKNKFRNAGIGEDDVKFPLRFDGLIKTIEVGQRSSFSLDRRETIAAQSEEWQHIGAGMP
jgi:hypothetical protein